MTDTYALELAEALAASDRSELRRELIRYLTKRLAELRSDVQQLSSRRPSAALLRTPPSMLFDVSDVDVVDIGEP